MCVIVNIKNTMQDILVSNRNTAKVSYAYNCVKLLFNLLHVDFYMHLEKCIEELLNNKH